MYARGAQIVTPDAADYTPRAVLAGAVASTIATLKDYLPPAFNQGQQGSCTGVAFKYAREVMHAIHGLPYTPLATAFTYTMERWLEGSLATDSGADPADGGKVLRRYGVCPESVMPYSDTSLYTTEPEADVLAAAFPWRITRTGRCRTVDEMRQCLAARFAIVIGIGVDAQFDQEAASGAIVQPRPAGTQPTEGHALCLYEIDTTAGVATALSNWGTPDHRISLGFLSDPAWCFTNVVIE